MDCRPAPALSVPTPLAVPQAHGGPGLGQRRFECALHRPSGFVRCGAREDRCESDGVPRRRSDGWTVERPVVVSVIRGDWVSIYMFGA